MKKGILGIIMLILIVANPDIGKAGVGVELRGLEAFWSGGLGSYTVSNMNIFIDASVGNRGYTNHVNDARSDYDGISYASIKYTTVTSSYWQYADVRVYAGSYGLDYAGRVQPYGIDGYVCDLSDRWETVNVILNDYYMDTYKYSDSNRRKTTIHEFGHALSLQHQASTVESVMKQGKYTYSNPTSLDIYNLQTKY